MKITALAGGVGGAKLLVGLQRADIDLTAIVNTADDAVIYDVHVSPDVDIVTYWLAGLADTERGWGVRGDTFEVVDALGRLGTKNWFRLGDRDFATCLYRTDRMRGGESLSQVTDAIRTTFGVPTTILPMSDDTVSTRLVTTDHRTLEFQEYFVAERQEPEITEVRFAGIADAKPGPRVLEAIETADKVILCPSNPVVSIGPILALPEVRDTLARHPSVTAISPLIRGVPLKGPADKLLRSVGAEVSASGVAALYRDFVDLFVVDETDAEEIDRVEAHGVQAVGLDTIMTDHDASERLARALL